MSRPRTSSKQPSRPRRTKTPSRPASSARNGSPRHEASFAFVAGPPVAAVGGGAEDGPRNFGDEGTWVHHHRDTILETGQPAGKRRPGLGIRKAISRDVDEVVGRDWNRVQGLRRHPCLGAGRRRESSLAVPRDKGDREPGVETCCPGRDHLDAELQQRGPHHVAKGTCPMAPRVGHCRALISRRRHHVECAANGQPRGARDYVSTGLGKCRHLHHDVNDCAANADKPSSPRVGHFKEPRAA